MNTNLHLRATTVRNTLLLLLLLAGLPMRSHAQKTNIALAGTPNAPDVGCSYCTTWNDLAAINNGLTGTANADMWGTYSGTRKPASEWVTYTWARRQRVDAASVWFWQDGTGVFLPASWRIQYYDRNARAWTDVTGASAYPVNATNEECAVTFDAVETNQLRLRIDCAPVGSAYGAVCVTEWAAYGEAVETGDVTYGDYPIANVPFSSVKLSDTFWSQRIAQNQQVTIPIALKQCYDNGRLDNFKKAAGAMEGYFVGDNTFDDTDIYKIVEGMAYSIQASYSKELDDEMDMLISWIARAQEPDGYLMTARTAAQPGKMHYWLGASRWEKDPDLSHELYNCGHLYEAAVAHYISTGKTTLLDVAVKSADLLVKDFLEGGLRYEPGHQIVEMGLVKMYRVTGKQQYLRLAKYFLDLRGARGVMRREYSQSHQPVTAQTEAVGHAVRAGYMYSGMTDVAAIMDDDSYRDAIGALWDNVVGKKFYINGGIGALHNGEAFGANYELPNASAYCETCAAISNVYWNHRMFLLTGDAKYYDVLERSLYNGVISGIGLDGRTFFYPNPLASTGGYKRSEWFGCACCPSNLCRFIPSVPGYAYAHRGDSIYVSLYMQSATTIDLGNGRSVGLSQQTEYPWKGDIAVKIDKCDTDAALTLMLRLPGWAQGQPVPSDLYAYTAPAAAAVRLYVNGVETPYTLADGYMAVSRTWAAGDAVTFSLPMDVHKTIANEAVADDANRVALERGPILYCLEWCDNDHVGSCIVDDAATASPEWTDGLGGVYSLSVAGKKATYDASGAVVVADAQLTAIPYYAWNNRGSAGAMEVWIPRDASLAQPVRIDLTADTVRVELEALPFTDTGAAIYDSTPYAIDKGLLEDALGIAAASLPAAFSAGELTLEAIEPDGTANAQQTAIAPGQWFDGSGRVVSWGADARVFSEFSTATCVLSVGQYPARCQVGDRYTFTQVLSYAGADNGYRRRLPLRVTLRIVDSLTPAAVAAPSAAAGGDRHSPAYDLTGRAVDAGSPSLPHGAYIVGGQKILR